MKHLAVSLAAIAALALCACEGMASGVLEDENDDLLGAPSAQQVPQPPTPMSLPNGQPRPGAMPQVIQPPAPPPTASAPVPLRASCRAPSMPMRTEASGAVEIKCGVPPTAAPAGMTCKAPEQLTYLTRNGASSFQCLR